MAMSVPRSGGDKAFEDELAVYRAGESERLCTIRAPELRKCQCKVAMAQIAYFEALLRFTDRRPQIGRGMRLQMLRMLPAGEPPEVVFDGIIDYSETKLTRENERAVTDVRLQARGDGRELMDSGVQASGDGSLVELIERLAHAHPKDRSVEFDDLHVEYRLDADSAFAALLLLGLSLDAVFYIDDAGTVVFRAKEAELARIRAAKPAFHLTEDDIASATFQDGAPLRRRQMPPR
jgi:hypothetical protein